MSSYEGSRLIMAVASEVITRSGYELVWDTNPACCDLCQRLNNKTIALGGQFADKSDGAGGLKRHPPLHKGCRCSVKPGRLLDSTKIPSNMWKGKPINPRLCDLDFEDAPFSYDDRLMDHIGRHIAPYVAADPTFDEEKYLQRARLLLAATPSDKIDAFIGKDNRVNKYDYANNDFTVGREDGRIATLFKPDDGAAYWEGKRRDHGIVP